jgi:hypothetical protein
LRPTASFAKRAFDGKRTFRSDVMPNKAIFLSQFDCDKAFQVGLGELVGCGGGLTPFNSFQNL